MRTTYLILAILGAIGPYLFFMQHFTAEGLGLPAFMAAVFANPAASGLTTDLLVASFVFWLLMLQERRLRQGPHPGMFIFLNLLVGLSCALPAYLFVREGAQQQRNRLTP